MALCVCQRGRSLQRKKYTSCSHSTFITIQEDPLRGSLTIQFGQVRQEKAFRAYGLGNGFGWVRECIWLSLGHSLEHRLGLGYGQDCLGLRLRLGLGQGQVKVRVGLGLGLGQVSLGLGQGMAFVKPPCSILLVQGCVYRYVGGALRIGLDYEVNQCFCYGYFRRGLLSTNTHKIK